MLTHGDVKLNPPFQPIQIPTQSGSIAGWRIYFAIRGTGNYFVDVPQSLNTAEIIAAVTAEATKICAVMDEFK